MNSGCGQRGPTIHGDSHVTRRSSIRFENRRMTYSARIFSWLKILRAYHSFLVILPVFISFSVFLFFFDGSLFERLINISESCQHLSWNLMHITKTKETKWNTSTFAIIYSVLFRLLFLLRIIWRIIINNNKNNWFEWNRNCILFFFFETKMLDNNR